MYLNRNISPYTGKPYITYNCAALYANISNASYSVPETPTEFMELVFDQKYIPSVGITLGYVVRIKIGLVMRDYILDEI